MVVETSALTLIRTKMQRLQLPGDLIPRRRLVDRLCAGSSQKLTLISAQARAGPEGIMKIHCVKFLNLPENTKSSNAR
jgi:hypothetical protein